MGLAECPTDTDKPISSNIRQVLQVFLFMEVWKITFTFSQII